MSSLTLTRRGLFPSLFNNELFDTGKFFNPELLDFSRNFPAWDFLNRIPPVNITENEKEFQVDFAAPGLAKKDFKIEMKDGDLIVSVEKKEEKKEEDENFSRKEFSFNKFMRSFRIPENCMMDKINAKYENGILSLMLPKKEVTVSKPVKEIKIS